MPDEAVAAPGFARSAGEGQHDQRVFQALGLVDSDHLDQRGLAFQPHDFLVRGVGLVVVGLADLAGQMADQRVLAVQCGGGLLQQFGQVQQVGQRALAVGAGQQLRGQVEQVQQVVQHRQHAMAQPAVVQLAEAFAALFPVALVLVEPVQFGVALGEGGAGQRRAHGMVGAGLGASMHPQQQVARLGRGVDRVAVGQVNAGQAARLQRRTHGAGLLAAAYQDGDVAGSQRRQCGVGGMRREAVVDETAVTLACGVQPLHQGGGSVFGHAGLISALAHRREVGGVGQLQRRQRLTVQQQALRAALCLHRQKRQALGALAEAERALRVLLGTFEYAVDRADHGGGGAVVGGQSPGGLAGARARLQVGVDIRAAKTVDRLLGVADQQQAGAGPLAVDALEDAPLQRVGVLEFINERHRVLAGDGLRQTLAADPMQGGVEPLEHVVVAELGQPLLAGLQPRGDPRHGVGEDQRFQLGRGVACIEQGIDGGEGRVLRCGLVFVGGRDQRALREASHDVVVDGVALRPEPHGVETGGEVLRLDLAGVQRALLHRLAQQRLDRLDVRLPQRACVLLGGAQRRQQRIHGRREVVDERQRMAVHTQVFRWLAQ